MPTVGCPHHRTQLIAKDSEETYVECLDCGAILEASEIDRQREAESDKGTRFDESLSDA
jgi:transcription initiation factor TFIIIB Brf1 subunit/transcription initiation factor TFIIB